MSLKCLRKNKNNKRAKQMQIEYEILETLAAKRWKILQDLRAVEAAIRKNSQEFYVGEDGLVEINMLEHSNG